MMLAKTLFLIRIIHVLVHASLFGSREWRMRGALNWRAKLKQKAAGNKFISLVEIKLYVYCFIFVRPAALSYMKLFVEQHRAYV